MLMAAASLLVTVNDALVKEALVRADTGEVLFFRAIFAMIPLLVYALAWGRPATLLPNNRTLALLL